MKDIINLDVLKINLNIESGYTIDDTLLENFLEISVKQIYDYCDGGLSGYTISGYTNGEVDELSITETTLPITVQQAIIMFASHLYLNRNMVSFSQGYEIPYTYKFLVQPYKNIIVG
jgi:hypothetical protein